MIYQGDCLQVMKTMASESIGLVYLDPPFFTQRVHKQTSRDGQLFSFVDTWDSLDDYLACIKERIIECRRILKQSGSIFFAL